MKGPKTREICVPEDVINNSLKKSFVDDFLKNNSDIPRSDAEEIIDKLIERFNVKDEDDVSWFFEALAFAYWVGHTAGYMEIY